MPKSKRDKKISLTRTTKKGLQMKQGLVQEIRDCLENYSHIYVFSVQNMRNSKLKDVRYEWKHSRFFCGKNKVMALALGRNPEEEIKENLHQIAVRLRGQCGLMFSNKSKEEVLQHFDDYSDADFARAGDPATETVILPEGPLTQFQFSLEPHLRKLGLPTTLKKAVVTLLKEHTVCQVGELLTPEQARILKLLDYRMAEFHITIECLWKSDGTFEDLNRGTLLPPVTKASKEAEGDSDADVDDDE